MSRHRADYQQLGRIMRLSILITSSIWNFLEKFPGSTFSSDLDSSAPVHSPYRVEHLATVVNQGESPGP